MMLSLVLNMGMYAPLRSRCGTIVGFYFCRCRPSPPRLWCSVVEIFEMHCRCRLERVLAAQANLPPFVTLDVTQKRLFSGLFAAGRGCLNPGRSIRPERAHPSRKARPPDMDLGGGQGYRSNVHVDRQPEEVRSVRKLYSATVANAQGTGGGDGLRLKMLVARIRLRTSAGPSDSEKVGTFSQDLYDEARRMAAGRHQHEERLKRIFAFQTTKKEEVISNEDAISEHGSPGVLNVPPNKRHG